MDSFEACTNELITFVRGMKRLSHPPAGSDIPHLERPALIMLFGLAEHGPARPSLLAEHVHLDLSTVSRQLAALESAGWVAREKDPADKRAQLAHLTTEGSRVLQANLAARRSLLGELLTDWTDGERREFARLLGRLNKSFDSHPATTPPSTGTCEEHRP